MAVESWISPEETPALAQAATALIEDRLSRFSQAEREAYWASIRKCYNTPYNPPPARLAAKATAPVSVIEIAAIELPPIEVQAAALAAAAMPAEIQAA